MKLQQFFSKGFIILFALGLFQTAKADEGMWLPFLVNNYYKDMQKTGLKLTAEQIYSVNKACLKDGILSLGGFCSGEMISEKGLFLTNHHCAHEAIQSITTEKNDYLKDGFWAKKYEEEAPIVDLSVSFLINVEDVTKEVLSEIGTFKDAAEWQGKAKAGIKKIEAKYAKEGYKINIESFFGGNDYYLFTYQEYTDIRLAVAPPESVGNFGNETDNWMWPRHTGDFSMFRIYANKDNQPATFSKNNQPYKPKHFFPINLDGTKEGDYAMILGYPGRTLRYLTSSQVALIMKTTAPYTVKLRDEKLKVMRAEMAKDHKVDIQYSAKMNQISNYWKYYIGQQEQIKNNKVIPRKIKEEIKFQKWVTENKDREAKYGTLLRTIASKSNEIEPYERHFTYLNEGIFGIEAAAFSWQFVNTAKALSGLEKESEEYKTGKAALQKMSDNHFKDYFLPIDKQIASKMIYNYSKDIEKDKLPESVIKISEEFGNNQLGFENFANKLLDNSMFSNQIKLNQAIKEDRLDALATDEVYAFTKDFITNYRTKISANHRPLKADIELLEKDYITALIEMNNGKAMYSDANFTMRLTYGNVKSYGKDGVTWNYYTTLKGVMDKEDPTNPEFIVADKLKELYNKRDFGMYANKDGVIPTCFITTNDITGGNSGSGVLDANGNLIGCAFDGNWESMSGDISYEIDLQRTICADIRYILFVVDKMGGCGHLLKEMSLIKDGKKVK